MVNIFSVMSCALLVTFAHAQSPNYSLTIRTSTVQAGGKSYVAYESHFSENSVDVEKAWWRYVKARATIFNRKEYLELTMPAVKYKSNTPLKFLSKWTHQKNSKIPILSVALLVDVDNKALQNDIKNLVLDFKVEYYSSLVQSKITSFEKSSHRLSHVIQNKLMAYSFTQGKSVKNDTLVSKTPKEIDEIKTLLDSLDGINTRLDLVKKDLTRIK